jgi:bacillithiol system protein YtxJ
MVELRTPEEVDRFLDEHPWAVIFKAGTCHKTMQGWGYLEPFLRDRDELWVGILRVVEHRPASNWVAERSGVVHQSPQVILFHQGRPLFDLDNWDITPQNLKPLFDRYLPAQNANHSPAYSELEPYKRLLDAYLAGQLSDSEFQWSYLNLFREDASLRSREEFELLNSLFGNPDTPHIHPAEIIAFEAQHPQTLPLKDRARRLREALEELGSTTAR